MGRSKKTSKLKKYKAALAAAAVLVLASALAPFASSFADNVSSTNFLVKDAFIGSFGGYASSTNFQMVTGGSPIMNSNATSASFGSNTGPVNYSEFSPASQNWRWYGDANDETPISPLAAENVAPSNIANGAIIKLRVTIKDMSGLAGSNSLKFRLQFAQASDFSASLGDVAEAATCGVTSTWCYATSTGGNDNAIISTKALTDSDACAGGTGAGCGTHNTSGASVSTSTQSAGAATEYEFTITAAGAAPGNTYFFRAINTADGSVVQTNATSSYPSLVTQGATLSFSVSGLPQGTSTNGIVTNVSSTSVGVPFGALTVASSVSAAQRISISTNAQNGYELYALQDSPLTDGHGDQIPGVQGTNTIPLPWSSACAATSSACYGYHPGSPVLSGGSTRFAPNDTYASLASSPAEIGYSGFPATSSTIDMIYRIQIAGNQGNGSYQNNIAYIVAPSF